MITEDSYDSWPAVGYSSWEEPLSFLGLSEKIEVIPSSIKHPQSKKLHDVQVASRPYNNSREVQLGWTTPQKLPSRESLSRTSLPGYICIRFSLMLGNVSGLRSLRFLPFYFGHSLHLLQLIHTMALHESQKRKYKNTRFSIYIDPWPTVFSWELISTCCWWTFSLESWWWPVTGSLSTSMHQLGERVWSL